MGALREIAATGIGAASGVLIGGAVALAAAWLSDDAYAGSWSAVSLVAVAIAAPVGAASAFLADRVLLSAIPAARLATQLPLLFSSAFVGALPAKRRDE